MRRLAICAVFAFPLLAVTTVHAWTDNTLTSDSTLIRKAHIDELRDGTSSGQDNLTEAIDGINDWRAEYGFATYDSWSSGAITADVTLIRKADIDEMRDKIDDIEATYPSCIDAGSPTAWTDSPITDNSTMVKRAHFNELRNVVDPNANGSEYGADNLPKTCSNCCGSCKTCSGSSGCTNQSSSSDLWNDCSTGTCRTGNCNGSGACGWPSDDSGCGTIDCDGLDIICRDYTDLTSSRCEGLADCKDANSGDCTSYTDTSAGVECNTCVQCGGGGVCNLPAPETTTDTGCPGYDCNCGYWWCDGYASCVFAGYVENYSYCCYPTGDPPVGMCWEGVCY